MRGRDRRDDQDRGGGAGQDARFAATGKQTLAGSLGVTHGGGARLPEQAHRRFEDSLGADLGEVRVHDGPASQSAAAQVGAKAFTVGQDIHFAAGQLQPEQPSGMHLLAHEVAHTVQQRGGAAGMQAKLDVSQPGDTTEVEADRFADHIVHGGAMPALSQAPAMIQRQDAGATPTPTPAPDGASAADQKYYGDVTTIIQQTLHDYQNLSISVPTIPPVPAAATPQPTPEATPEPTAAAPQAVEPVMVTVTVGTPYWNNKYPSYDPSKDAGDNNPRPTDAYSQANAGTDPKTNEKHTARSDAFTAYQARGETGTLESAEWTAKGSPGQITELVQGGVSNGQVPAPTPAGDNQAGDEEWWKSGWKKAIELWMVQVGIGVDCNGLVFEALLRVRGGTKAVSTKEAGGAWSAIDSYTPGNRTKVSVEALGGDDIYPDDPDKTSVLGNPVNQLELQPGDVMYLSHSHVRIVMSIEQRSSSTIEFTTAESTVAGRYVPGQTYEGPRTHHWKWDGTKLWERYETPAGDPTEAPWTEAHESPSYCRHLLPPSAGKK